MPKKTYIWPYTKAIAMAEPKTQHLQYTESNGIPIKIVHMTVLLRRPAVLANRRVRPRIRLAAV